jgi:predicted nucleic acid-binding protein
MDTLHVATAMHIGATDFLTFDTNQRQLAETVGLTVDL